MTQKRSINLWGTFWFFLAMYLIWAIGYGIVKFGFPTTLIIGAIWFGIFGVIALSKRAKSASSQSIQSSATSVDKKAPDPPDVENPTQPNDPISVKPQLSGRTGVVIGVIVSAFFVILGIAGMFGADQNDKSYPRTSQSEANLLDEIDVSAWNRQFEQSDSQNISSWDDSDLRTVQATLRRAEIGDTAAQYSMGHRFYQGRGVTQDFEQAFCWFQHAANADHPLAMSSLGNMYGLGHGTKQDNILAHKWYNLAGARGDESARDLRDMTGRLLTPYQIETAQSLAREWKPHRTRGEPVLFSHEDQEEKYFCDMRSPAEL